MTISAEVATKLLQIKAIKLSPQNPFTWASGLQSPIYCDNRIILSYPEVRTWMLDRLEHVASALMPFDAVAGVATAGIPMGTLLADKLALPLIYVRSKAKEHGRKNQIEGRFSAGQKVLVVEDLISTGGSALAAVQVLREAGCEVVAVLANFQYGLPEAEERFEKAGCDLYTLSDYSTLIQMARNAGYVDADDLVTLRNWQSAPDSWSVKFSQSPE